MAKEEKWIPANDASPVKDGWYLSTYDGDVYGAEGERAVGLSLYEHGGWIEDRVYAWMPLPEPFEG